MLLSSHLLNEVELIADEIIIIGRGRIVAQGTKDELLAGSGTFIRSVDADPRARRWPRRRSSPPPTRAGACTSTPSPLRRQRRRRPPDHPSSCAPERRGLEDLFLDLTADAARRGGGGMTATTQTQISPTGVTKSPRTPSRPCRPTPRCRAASTARAPPQACPSAGSSTSSCARCSTPVPVGGSSSASARSSRSP